MDNSGICKREGYQYRYRFRSDDDVIPNEIIDGYEPSPEKKVYFFEIRTNFTVKGRLVDGGSELEELIGSEVHRTCMKESDGEDYLRNWMSCRLEAYWMPKDGIESMVPLIFDFAKRCSADDDDRLSIGVAVDLYACTVQLEREPIADAFARAIRADERECLGLPKIRVEDVDRGLTLMDTCPICYCRAAVGAHISALDCGHAFHYHCVVASFIKHNSCPSCRCAAFLRTRGMENSFKKRKENHGELSSTGTLSNTIKRQLPSNSYIVFRNSCQN